MAGKVLEDAYAAAAGSSCWETIPCPTCGGTDFDSRLKIGLDEFSHAFRPDADLSLVDCKADTKFTYAKCRGCGAVIVNPRLNSQATITYYSTLKKNKMEAGVDQAYQDQVLAPHSSDRTLKMMGAMPYLILALALKRDQIARPNKSGSGRPLRLLDYGCGFGYLLRLAHLFGLDARGIDVDSNRIEVCRKLGLNAGTREEMLVGEKVDIVTSQAVLEHVNDPAQYLADISGVLNSGGVFICNGLTPSIIDIELRRRRYKLVHPIEHVNLFESRAFCRFLERYDLRVPSRLELFRRLRPAMSIYERLPHLIYGAVKARDGHLHAISFKN